MDSKLALIVQLNGVFLVTILSLVLRRSLKFKALRYWTTAWLCLSFSLIALRLAFDLAGLAPVLFTYHLLGEYIFGFMLAAGCRSLGTDADLSQRAELLILPLVGLSVVLPLVTLDLNDALFYQSFVMSGLFAVALFTLRRAGIKTFGSKLMGMSLLLLAVEPFLFLAAVSIQPHIPAYFELASYRFITSLVSQSGLGLGTVIILIEKAIADFRNANNELHEAHQRLEELVHTDPLTAAFNRHAFYGFVNRGNEDGRTIAGCVGFFDIDDLKEINDRFGHAAGDAAIRLVARAIRNIIRAEDLIYRWGGDEFFVIMVSMDADFAESRMIRLPELLTDVWLEGADEPYSIGVSWGFKDFSDSAELEEAIKIADREMYRRKHEQKGRVYDLPKVAGRPELTAL